MGLPLWVTQPFSLAALSILSFMSTLLNLTIMCLGVALLAEEQHLCDPCHWGSNKWLESPKGFLWGASCILKSMEYTLT